jgi:hypothetical protein
MKVLTIVSKPPATTSSPGSSQSAPIDDGNLAVDGIVAKLSKLSSDQVISRAIIVRDVVSHVRDDEFDLIQIVGHACSGILSLGYHWSRSYGDREKGYQVIDSNPYVYSVLSESLKKKCPVVLVGCYVGSNEKSPFVANGTTLLTDLAQMWGMPVFGSDTLVGPEDFDGGIYRGSIRSSDGEHGALNDLLHLESPNRGNPDAARPGLLGKARLLFLNYRGAPRVGPAYRPAVVALPRSVADALSKAFSTEVTTQPLLALPEIELDVVLPGDGVSSLAQVICGGRLLRVQAGDRTRYFGNRSLVPEANTVDALRQIANFALSAIPLPMS